MRIFSPMELARWLADVANPGRSDHAPDWTEEIRDEADRDFDPQPGDVCEPGEGELCEIDRVAGDVMAAGEPDYPVVDIEAAAASARYESGALKRTRYPLVELRKRKVVVVLHQMGVERAEASTRWKLVTCHRNIGPSGVRRRVHPLRVRLTAANRVDRSPFHAISIELAGNVEGTDGTGDWWMPNVMGKGRFGEGQIVACRQEVRAICGEVRELGGQVVAILPHRITGRNAKGKPNRPLCCGSRGWSEIGERSAQELGLQTPAPGFALGGTAIPGTWRGPYADPRRATFRG